MDDKKKMESENLKDVSGGRMHPKPGVFSGSKDVYCLGYPGHPKHEFEFIPNTETPDQYYGISRCTRCGYEKKVYQNPTPLD